jgi:hypothetical protein
MFGNGGCEREWKIECGGDMRGRGERHRACFCVCIEIGARTVGHGFGGGVDCGWILGEDVEFEVKLLRVERVAASVSSE